MKDKKNYKFSIITFIFILLFNFFELFKYKVFNIDFSVINYIIKLILIFSMFFVNTLKNKNSFYKNLINFILIIIGVLSFLFNSANVIGLLILYLFIILISITFMIKSNLKFEYSLPISVSIVIILFILIGLLGLLKYSIFLLLILVFLSIYYLFKNKKFVINKIVNINKKSIIIFSILFLLAILSGVGRYVHVYDEYSYWAYAAKVLIETDSMKTMISSVGAMNSYPPVSSIWHYIIHIFLSYSEPNLYIGLVILDFIYLMPVFSKLKNNKFLLFNIPILSVAFPILFGGSIGYTTLYVDILLAFICSSILILHDGLEDDEYKKVYIAILLIIMTLLKPNGFVFSCSLLLLFFIQDICKEEKVSFKIILKKLKKYILPVICIFVLFLAWNILSKILFNEKLSYNYNLIPDSLSKSISAKLNKDFVINYFNSIISSVDDTVIYSFINIPLFVYLIGIFSCIWFFDKNEKRYNIFRSLIPYLIFYVVFFLLTALSLFIMFTYYEASVLASFARYLAPINISLFVFCLYKLSFLVKFSYKYKIIIVVIMAFIGFGNITSFVTDVKDKINTNVVSETRKNDFSTVNKYTELNSKVFIINQKDSEGIMPVWYARYYCYPRITNSNPNAITWKILTKENSWDLKGWGLTNDAFDKHIIDYDFDYVYLYSSTNQLYEKLNVYVDDKYDIKKYKLFRVENIDGNLNLLPIK